MANKQDGLVKKLSRTRDIVLQDGVETIIKPIPDADVTGDLDPRVLAVTQGYDATEPETSFDLTSARASMGWPNRDVTRMDIATDYVTIPSADGDIPARLYRPRTEETLPAILFFHGGGFFGGTLDTVENPCKLLAEKANALVVSVDYRLAPEHPFPAGLNDCYRALEWVHERADDLRVSRDDIAVAGDSAGGNLATACCLLDRSNGTNMIRFQALIYPVVNLRAIPTDDYEWTLDRYEIKHHHDLIRGVVMALGDSEDLLNQIYLQGKAELTDPLVSPLFAEDVAGLPPALLITAEYDYLRLEGEAYARKLARDGVPTRLIQYRGMDHAFMDKLGDYPQAEDCMIEIANGMKEMTR